MVSIVWHKGPPPHVGWWNASVGRRLHVWRWWDGKRWSLPAFPHHDAVDANQKAQNKPDSTKVDIPWNFRWPLGAAVPRIDPDDSRRGPAFVNEVLQRVRGKPRNQWPQIITTVKSEMA